MTRGTHADPYRYRMPRRRGAVAGPLIMLVGAWGALIPFFGHHFGFGYTPDNTWTWTAARGWLEVAPGAGAFFGGLLLAVSDHRGSASFGGWLAAASGAWFVLGTIVSPWWSPGYIGQPVGSSSQAVWERIDMFTGVGLVILFLAAMSLGQINLSGYRRVTTAPPDAGRTIPGERPRTVDLTAAEAGSDSTATQTIRR